MKNETEKLKGSLEIICGSMFSGKSEELIRRMKRAEFAKLPAIVFKPAVDSRRGINLVTSHNGFSVNSTPISNPKEIVNLSAQKIVVGIDEVQFFPKEIINVICTLVESGKRVIAAGLDLDFRGVPFGTMPTLMAIADTITKLKAICMDCGNEAHFTQRLVSGQPARYHDPIIMLGAEEKYQARCRNCYKIDTYPTF